jgi:PAS domain S-box-containing protein
MEAQERVQSVEAALTNRLAILQFASSFYAGSEEVERREFHTFSSPILKNNRDIEFIGWLPEVPENSRADFEKKMQKDDIAEFRVHGIDNRGVERPSTPRAKYYPFLFVEPQNKFHALLGLDSQADEPMRKAIERVISTRCPTIVQCDLPDADGKITRFLCLLAYAEAQTPPPDSQLFRRLHRGVVLSAIRLRTLVEDAIRPMPLVGVNMYFYEKDARENASLLLARPSRLEKNPLPVFDLPPEKAEGMDTFAQLTVADRSWIVYSRPIDSYLRDKQGWEPFMATIAGLLATAILVGFLHLLIGRTERVEYLVEHRTEALRISEERFRCLVDGASDAFFLIDTDGRFFDVNLYACESLGYTREELLKMRVEDVQLQPLRWENGQPYWKFPEASQPMTYEGVHRRKDGGTFPVEVRLSFLQFLGRYWCLALSRDITERKRSEAALRASEERFRRLANVAGDALFLHDTQGKILEVNRRACERTGFSREEFQQMKITDIDVNPYKINGDEFPWSLPESSYPLTYEGMHRQKDGELFPVEVRLSVMDAEDHRICLALVRDVTERKRAEAALKAEDRMLRQLLDLLENDRKLIAYEIHDGLAQQLTGLLMQLQAMQIAKERKTPAEALENFPQIFDAAEKSIVEVRRLIGGLRPPVLDETGIVAAIDYLVEEKRKSETAAIEFKHDVSFRHLAGPLESAIYRIVQESLTNACRYSKSERIEIELRQTEDSLLLKIQDWGEGFDPQKIEGPHYGIGGIRQRARLLGGSAEIVSAPGEGTTVIVRLPLVEQAFDEDGPMD